MFSKYVFVSGPSESGKSGGVNYIASKFSNVLHLKIRNVFRELYEQSESKLCYEDWYESNCQISLKQFWINFILKVNEEFDEKFDVVMLDTMYGIAPLQCLYDILGEKISVLYIDADEHLRIMREFNRLRKDSNNSDRKADMSITFEEVENNTRKKDEKKKTNQMFDYPRLFKKDGKLVLDNSNVSDITFVITNNGSEEEFKAKLDTYIMNLTN